MWTYGVNNNRQILICNPKKQMTHKHAWHETVIHVANNSKWHPSIFWHETVIHMWQTTANDTQTCLTWNSYPYVANNSKWHQSFFWHETVIHMWKQQQMTHRHVWHETVIHMWQTTANDTQAFLTWNSCPCVANNSKWHTSMFDMKQLSICGKQQQMTPKHFCLEAVVHMWQTTANDTQTSLTWNSCPYVANNSKWHTTMFDMKQLSMYVKQQQMTYKNFWHETVIHVLCIYLFKIYFTFLISKAVKLTKYTERKTKIFTYNIGK